MTTMAAMPIVVVFIFLEEMEVPRDMISHVDKIFRGEYDPRIQVPPGALALDVGANVGGFSVWFLRRYPESRVMAYEPSSANFEILRTNLAAFPDRATLQRTAVGNPGVRKLYKGANNCGECSFYQLGEQKEEFEEVISLDPSVLPPAFFLKIDTEGCEVEILTRITLTNYSVIAFEYHSVDDRLTLDALLSKDFVLTKMELSSLRTGTAIYLAKNIIKHVK